MQYLATGLNREEPMAIRRSDIASAVERVERMRDELNAAPDGDPTTPTGVIREIRQEGRARLGAILDRNDLSDESRAAIRDFYEWLCGTDRDEDDPRNFSYAKRLHIAVQQFGARVSQIIRNDLGKRAD
jgi:hypothetical protein